ncbi:Glycosyltransferase, GT2 family [Flavobacterium micromati]|uniref:Glycosyltransferase, GT2 family n=1 Tax=Flavobacterium micromati TaxID=229205 RepID=A0A1M5H4U6_9FLAO|nr:glycosyltransferase [Flavobacterium micromati]SHG11061.1 Glycosyltransferase, GT2 family [Flavobacterium micromati]
MIVVYHSGSKISAIITADNQSIAFNSNGTIANGLSVLAQQFPDATIVWCNIALKENLNLDAIPLLLHHNKMMLSYSSQSYIGNEIGYVEESLFANSNKKVSFATWQMCCEVGAIHATVINAIKDKILPGQDFDYYLNSVAKLSMPYGLLCYSEPALLKNQQIFSKNSASIYTLFRFVKQHYKTRWLFLLFFNMLIYDLKFPLFPMIFSFFYKKRNSRRINLDHIAIKSSKTVIDKKTVDVIIPTIGREDYLYVVLKDFAVQTHLPEKIIIVEQNPDPLSKSNLEYIYNEKWPFKIQHFFIHQAGACNARNLALSQVESEWVFLADDDIKLANDFLNNALETIIDFGTNMATLSCLQKGENHIYKNVMQWGSFGSGCSLVKAAILQNTKFNMGFEFGYGEDNDFGMQLRHQGHDVLYLPHPEILHLKAPIGGFRTKPQLLWRDDKVQPKPSPTVMLYILSNNTKQQLLGYKTTLFLKYYKHQKIKNPLSYLLYFQKQWKQSVFWANQLKAKS